MPKRVGLTILASVILVLSLGITAIAQPAAPTAGSADAALAVGNEQLGKPFAYGAEGPDAFSCVGLMRSTSSGPPGSTRTRPGCPRST